MCFLEITKAFFIFTTKKSARRFSLPCPRYQLYQLKAPGHDSRQNGIHVDRNKQHCVAVPEKVVMRPIPPHSGLSCLRFYASVPSALRPVFSI